MRSCGQVGQLKTFFYASWYHRINVGIFDHPKIFQNFFSSKEFTTPKRGKRPRHTSCING